MDDIIPPEIKLNNIFSRLPVISVLECRRVCKSWRNLLQFHHDTHFAHLHLRYNHGLITKQQYQILNSDYDISRRDGTTDFGTMGFLIFDRQRTYYAEYHEQEEELFFHSTRINLTFPIEVRRFLVSSCNGLICLSHASQSNGKTCYSGRRYPRTVEPLYICNPITQEIVTIPGFYVNEKHENGINLVHGFGYHPLTNEYKVVRICYLANRECECLFIEGNVEVYTLGNGEGWRNTGKIDYYIVPNAYSKTGNNCVNGAIHWLKYETGDTVAFDLAEEEFHLVSTPPGLFGDWKLSSRILVMNGCLRIIVMNGCLCLARKYQDYGVDLWMLKKNDKQENAGTDNHLGHANDRYYKSWSWSKEFHVAPTESQRGEIFGHTKRDELLFAHFMGSITRYNPRTRTSKKFDHGFLDALIISHTNSFVSLKALGEVNVETCIGSTDHDDFEYNNEEDDDD